MNLISARRKAKLSREKAAVKLDVSFSTLVRWEKGVSRMPADILPKLRDIYSLSESEIFGLFDEQTNSSESTLKAHPLQGEVI